MQADYLFQQFTVELITSPIQRHRLGAFELTRDWICARARLWAEISSKLFYFRQLPWRILGMSHHKHSIAMLSAQTCIKLFDDLTSPGRDHRQSQRFLSATFIGDSPEDVPLRPWVERLAQGAPFDELGPLQSWLGRLAVIKVAERSVEGIHSLITKVYRRAPAATFAYISVELRLRDIVRTLQSDPGVPWLGLSLTDSD